MTSRTAHAARRVSPALLVLVLLVSACSSGDGSAASTTAEPVSTSTTPTTVSTPMEQCDQGATIDQVQTEPVADVASDLEVTSFDGTVIRAHWFPVGGPAGSEPAPTILMGPGWSLAGDTSVDGAVLFGALSIKTMHENGYNVLTWDPRGFGESAGVARVNDPDAEGRDVQVLIDWVSEQPAALLDDDGDPRVGMIGFSYGGGISLTVAAIDCRVDAIAPGIAWHSLETSLYKSETVKAGWSALLTNVAAGAELDPHILSAAASGISSGLLSEEDEQWFIDRGPGDLVSQIEVPTLFLQGTVDGLFTLDEAITNYIDLRDRGVPSAMLWFCGGHGTCLTEVGDADRTTEAELAWLARYLKQDDTVDTGPRFEFVDQDGTSWTADDYPEPDASLDASLRPDDPSELELTTASAAGPVVIPADKADILSGLVAGILPAPADVAVSVPITAEVETMVLGAPRLSITYTGTEPEATGTEAEKPTRIFAQLVDEERQVVVGTMITPVPVVLDGTEQTLEIDLEVVAQHLDPGATLTLELVATTPAYAEPRLGGRITFSTVDISLPVVSKGLTRR